ncbi:MAG: hypothetical protein ACI9MR_001330 [Myxococcota bacterium]|jgi:hypothetical protein
MSRFAAIVTSLVGLTALLGACTIGEVDAAGTEASLTTERFAIVSLTYSENAEAGASDSLVAQAWFVARDPSTHVTLAHVLDLPAALHLDADVAPETCRVETRSVDGGEHGLDRADDRFDTDAPQITLLDAGVLTVSTNGRTAPLDSFWFPEVYPEVGGLAYASVVRDTASFDDGVPVGISADGSEEVGPFALAITPPAPMRLEEVSYVDGALSVRWEAAEVAPNLTAPVVVRFIRRGFDTVTSVTCAADDDGSFLIPAEALADLADLGDDASDRLLVERYLHRDFRAEGISGGFVMAVAQDTVLVE